MAVAVGACVVFGCSLALALLFQSRRLLPLLLLLASCPLLWHAELVLLVVVVWRAIALELLLYLLLCAGAPLQYAPVNDYECKRCRWCSRKQCLPRTCFAMGSHVVKESADPFSKKGRRTGRVVGT